MKKLKCCTIIGIIFVLVLGTIFHFLYEWTENNFVVGLFAPVESISKFYLSFSQIELSLAEIPFL